MIENYEIRDAIIAASKHEYARGELTEQIASIFAGLRLGLDEAGILAYDEADPVYAMIYPLECGIRDRIQERTR